MVTFWDYLKVRDKFPKYSESKNKFEGHKEKRNKEIDILMYKAALYGDMWRWIVLYDEKQRLNISWHVGNVGLHWRENRLKELEKRYS